MARNKKQRDLILSKPKNQNLTRKTGEYFKFHFSRAERKKKFPFFADTQLKFDQIKRKKVARFNKPFPQITKYFWK